MSLLGIGHSSKGIWSNLHLSVNRIDSLCRTLLLATLFEYRKLYSLSGGLLPSLGLSWPHQ